MQISANTASTSSMVNSDQRLARLRRPAERAFSCSDVATMGNPFVGWTTNANGQIIRERHVSCGSYISFGPEILPSMPSAGRATASAAVSTVASSCVSGSFAGDVLELQSLENKSESSLTPTVGLSRAASVESETAVELCAAPLGGLEKYSTAQSCEYLDCVDHMVPVIWYAPLKIVIEEEPALEELVDASVMDKSFSLPAESVCFTEDCAKYEEEYDERWDSWISESASVIYQARWELVQENLRQMLVRYERDNGLGVVFGPRTLQESLAAGWFPQGRASSASGYYYSAASGSAPRMSSSHWGSQESYDAPHPWPVPEGGLPSWSARLVRRTNIPSRYALRDPDLYSCDWDVPLPVYRPKKNPVKRFFQRLIRCGKQMFN